MPAIPRTRFAVLALATMALTLALALPAAATASQTLTVEKAGAGTGTLTSVPSGIECGASCQASFGDGATVTLTGAPGPNSAAATWSGCDSVNGEGKCIVTMSAARSVIATFGLLHRQLTVTREGDSTGTVSSSPAGISCGATCTAEYLHGTQVTLTGTPTAPHTAPTTWSGCDDVDAEDRCAVTMSAAKEVKAAFDVERHKLTVMTNGTGTGSVASSPAGISCGATCHAEYEHGTAVVLTATPGTHTAPATWSGCDDIVSGNKCEVSMTSAKTVTATFNLIQFALTVAKAGPGAPNSTVASTPAGTISCGTACSALLTEGATLTLTATSGPNVAPVIWSGCTSVGKKNECLLTMSAAKAVTATFEPVGGVEVLALDVAKAGNGEGTITGSPGGIECGSVCETELVEGAVVSLSATPAPGSVFGHWSGGGCTGAGPCVTTLRTARTVTATFLLSGTRTLSVSKSGSGQGTVTSRPVGTGIDCGQTCSAPVPAGTAVILTAKAAKGSSFGHWSGACFGTAASCKVTMSEARSVGASFSAPPAAAAPPPPPSRKPPRCKQGFKRRRVHGKPRCVKKHKHQAKRGASHQRG